MITIGRFIHFAHRTLRTLRLLGVHLRLALPTNVSIKGPVADGGLIVSLTSYPPRIRGCWVAIESIFRQSELPDALVLTLCETDFPGRKLPFSLRVQQSRGLTVLWVEQDGKSFDKLLPVRRLFPSASVITIDDDVVLPASFIAEMREAHRKSPRAIIGYRGWEIMPVDGTVLFGQGWRRAGAGSPSDRLFFAGNAGVLYPPGSLADQVFDIERAFAVSPSADDIWFWACAVVNGTELRCLGKPAHMPVLFQRKTPALNTINAAENGPQFDAAIKEFDLREIIGRASGAGD